MLIVILVFIIVLFVIFFAWNAHQNNLVMSSSKKIDSITKLNKSTHFNTIQSSFKISKHYDNKSNFNKIEPAYLMASNIRENIDHFSKYIAAMKENREKHMGYKEHIQSILEADLPIEVDASMSEAAYKKREAKLCKKIELKPTIDCAFHVNMSYSSPKGKVNLSKDATFNFDDLFVCYESVARSRLDKKTYNILSTVERGEVSDSLRYDILNRDNFTCVICGASSKQGVRLHVDHIIPIAKGGTSTPDNLRTLCERCNIGKSDKTESNTTSSDDNVCKWCGKKLVLRKGKYGNFYGCSDYPRCKFTQKIH